VKRKTNKPHYQVTAGLIWRNSRVLITKRPEGTHLAGFWEFPGGKQEPYETLDECLVRELKEELGITVRTDRHLLTVEHEYEDKVITLHVFHCRDMKGRPATLEGQEFRWVHPQDLSNYTFPPPDKAVIETLRSRGQPPED
jgi:8-oxo-dGTP diphosphatase